jgi:hypothetical protein
MRTSVRYASGSMSFNLQFSIRNATVAQCSAPPSEPANKAFFRLSAIGRMEPLDGVVVELNATVINEARQSLTARQGIADCYSKLAFLADQAELCAQPRFERVDQGTAFRGSDGSAVLGTSAPNVFLDGVEPGNPFERFARDRCRTREG